MSIPKIVSRYKLAVDQVAMEFDTPEAMKKYLEEHPGADKSNHSVKKHEEVKPGLGEHTEIQDLPWVPEHSRANLAKAMEGRGTPKEITEALDTVSFGLKMVDDSKSMKKLKEARDYLTKQFTGAVQNSVGYATTKTPGYRPKSKPAGYKENERARQLIDNSLYEEDFELLDKMPESAPDAEEESDHRSLTEAIQSKLEESVMGKSQIFKRVEELNTLSSKLKSEVDKAKSDKEADGWRFPANQVANLRNQYLLYMRK